MSTLLRRLVTTGALVTALGGGALLSASPAHAAGPFNDNMAGAAPLSGAAGQFIPSLNNGTATAEPGEPAHYVNGSIVVGAHRSVWFKWTALATADTTFRTQGSSFDTVMAVYRQDGVGFGGLTQMDSDDDTTFSDGTNRQSQVHFTAAAGQEYLIVVDSYGAATGDVKLSWNANDDFHAAQVITGPAVGSVGIVGTNTEGATAEIQERAHAGDPAQHSVWFSWTAPRSGTATFQSTLDNFDTQLAVYTGTNVAALNLVAENNNTANGRQALVTFKAVAGTTYKIVLDGFGGDRGRTAIQYSLV
jgi:hypothetical protein